MSYTVYRVVNSVNNIKYYGATTQPIRDRLYGHTSRARTKTSNSDLHKVMCELGVEKFSLEPLAYCSSKSEMLELEHYLINSTESVYNVVEFRGSGNREAGKWNTLLKGHSVHCSDGNSFQSIREAARFYGVSDSTIGRAIKANRPIKNSLTFKRN